MGELNKSVFSNFAEFNCERQLFLRLGKDDDAWINPFRKLKPLDRRRIGNKVARDLGNQFEQKIYNNLKELPNTIYSQSPTGLVSKKIGTKQILINYANTLSPSQSSLILLEHEFQIPLKLMQFITGEDQIPIQKPANFFKPDILVLEKIDNQSINYRINASGDIVECLPTHKFKISVIDIKVTSKETVGKKQLIELIYYIYAINQFLEEEDLSQQFCVSPYGNGILASKDKIFITSLPRLRDEMVQLNYSEMNVFFQDVCSNIQNLTKNRPLSIDAIPLNLQPACGRCSYLEDCKYTLGYDEDKSNWKIELIPRMTKASADQLKNVGVYKVKDLNSYLQNFQVQDVPNPLYPQLPYLELLTKALTEDKFSVPEPDSVYTAHIPKFIDIAIIFNIERDPIHDRAIGVTILMDLSVFQKSLLYDKFHCWLTTWKDFLFSDLAIEEVIEEIKAMIDNLNFAANTSKGGIDKKIKRFGKYLKDISQSCKQSKEIFEFRFPEKDIKSPLNLTIVKTFINSGLTDSTEFTFIKQVTEFLVKIQYIIELTEIYVINEIRISETERYIVNSNSAIYHWSNEVLQALEQLLERNLSKMLFDSDVRQRFMSLITWFTPSDSQVKNPLQLKKVFDLQNFAESVLGVPTIINYTWHELAALRLDLKFNYTYWNPHFNYLDFKIFHDFLNEEDFTKKQEHYNELQKQLSYKAKVINNLRTTFQKDVREISVNLNQLTSNQELRQYHTRSFPSTFHSIAVAWYIFAKLTSSVGELEVLNFRTMFPMYSIGKLRAGEVSDLSESVSTHPGRGSSTIEKFQYTFRLKGLSSNMKIKVGDRVNLIPNTLRQSKIGEHAWKITVRSLEWDYVNNCYLVSTDLCSKSLFREYINYMAEHKEIENADPYSEEWYLYPTSMDAWSRKLFRLDSQDTLFERKPFARSWLGHQLTYIWNLFTTSELKQPQEYKIWLSEAYLYNPLLLDQFALSQSSFRSLIFPQPNESQIEAIQNSISKPISLIQGPPGTGKSRTIIGLMDDFLIKRKESFPNRPIRILVTSFSYAALYVLMDMLIEGEDAQGNSLPISTIDKVFIRSSSQNPRENLYSTPRDPLFIHDIVRNNNTWKLNGESRTITPKIKIEDNFSQDLIIFANAHSLFAMKGRNTKSDHDQPSFRAVYQDFAFDLIIVDEASQVPVDQILASLQFIHDYEVNFEFTVPNNTEESIGSLELAKSIDLTKESKLFLSDEPLTNVVLVGDHNQLPPVQPVKPPKKLEIILGSAFAYYAESGHNISSKQLKINYRSHDHIVQYTKSLGFYTELSPYISNANTVISGDIPSGSSLLSLTVLKPERVVMTVIHETKEDVGVSILEAEIVADLVISYYQMEKPQTPELERYFWMESIGIVAPHNAQGSLITRMIYHAMISNGYTKLLGNELMTLLSQTIYSVEKFQGSARKVIIASIGISSIDQLKSEEEFIFDLNRFNVLSSRAKSKIVLLASRNFLKFIPNSIEIMEYSEKIRHYAFRFCNTSELITFNNQNLEIRWFSV
jgi:hypothetical protein